jgi:Fanconi-associated nuclease 1
MITRFIKHPKSTNFDGEQDRPPKRQKTGDSPKKPPPTPRRTAKREVPDSDAEDDDTEVKEEAEERVTDLESALPHVKTGEDAVKEYEAFKASQENRTEEADERLEKRSWVRGKSSLYVDAFNLALDTVLDEESHLFDEAETKVFRIWRNIGYEAQYLYV